MLDEFATKKSFEIYVDYLAIRRHFESTYDYFKYNGKIRANFDSFRKRSDLYSFYKLSKQVDSHGLILSNVLENHGIWIGDIVSPQGKQTYLAWKKRTDSLSYFFKNELNQCKDSYKENFSCNNSYPYLYELAISKEISIETFVILARAANVFDIWKKKIPYDVGLLNTALKYEPFLKYDRKKFRELIKKRFSLV